MFNATKKALDRTIEDFLFADFMRIVISALVYMATLVYRIFLGNLLGLYIPLLCITVVYLTEYLVFTNCGANLKMTGAKKKALTWYRWTKRAFTLAITVITVASLVETVDSISPLAVILAVFSAVCLVLQIVFELIAIYIKKRFSMIRDGVKEDIDEIARMAQPIIRPIRFIQRIVTERNKKREAKETKTAITDEADNDVENRKTPLLQAAEAPSTPLSEEERDPPKEKRSFFARLFKKKQPPLVTTAEEEKSDRHPMPKEEVGKDGITYLVADYSVETPQKKNKK